MKFTKMHGIGNDYIYVNCFEEQIQNPAEMAKKLSDRHFGVGSDGLVLICPSEKADVRMNMYNADGTQAEMCGNAIRCVGKYIYDRKMTDKTSVTVETLSGIKKLELEVCRGAVRRARVNMGKPEFSASAVPVVSDRDTFIGQTVTIDGLRYTMTCVSMGNPHAVVFMKEIDNLELDKLGPKFERHTMFPKRTNTEFVQVIDDHTIKMRVWERGAGETLACGTGACAAMAACKLAGFVGDEAEIVLLGGTLHVEWKNDTLYMTGPAEFVFDGELETEG